MARSDVSLKQYMFEIRHEISQQKKSEMFPDGLLFAWIHKDLTEAVLRLGGLVNNLFRANATIAVASALGHYDASVDHVASALTITNFSGLGVDDFAGGSILAVDSDVFYSAQIVSNTATVVTISVGTDLPAISTGPVILTANNANVSLVLTSLSMINYSEPIWQVLDSNDDPIEQISLEMARNITNDPSYDDEVYWYQVGQSLYFAIGADASLSGNTTVGYYVLPTEATALTDEIDFPIEWHDLPQQRTMIRVLKKMGQYQKAQEKEVDLEKRWQEIERSNIQAIDIDRKTGERM